MSGARRFAPLPEGCARRGGRHGGGGLVAAVMAKAFYLIYPIFMLLLWLT